MLHIPSILATWLAVNPTTPKLLSSSSILSGLYEDNTDSIYYGHLTTLLSLHSSYVAVAV